MPELAINGGPKVRTKPWPKRGKRFGKEELKELKEALDQNTLFYAYGKKTPQLCSMMARKCGVRYVVACSSGSASIHGAIKACGVGPGDEVITSPITDAGSILGIIYEGAIPIFADIDPLTYGITARSVEARMTARTKAVLLVHLAGCPADVKPVARLCKRKKVKLIEDCAQSWATKVDGRWVGTFGDAGCFSLNEFKHISAGEGGLIVTDDPEIQRLATLSVDKCYNRAKGRRDLPFVAPNYRITELQSAVGVAQLRKVNGITSTRHRLGERLSRGLRKIRGVRPPKIVKGGYATYWFYLMQLDTDYLGVDAKKFAEALNHEGIPGSAGYVTPVYLGYKYLRSMKPFSRTKWPFSGAKSIPPYGKGYCPNAETVFDRCFNFALNEWLAAEDIDDVTEAVAKVAAHFRERKVARRSMRRK